MREESKSKEGRIRGVGRVVGKKRRGEMGEGEHGRTE